jgi:hypothetical protein
MLGGALICPTWNSDRYRSKPRMPVNKFWSDRLMPDTVVRLPDILTILHGINDAGGCDDAVAFLFCDLHMLCCSNLDDTSGRG